MSKVFFPIAIVLGLACGLTLREFKTLAEKEAVAARDIEEPAIQEDVRMNGQGIGPGWGLDGTLSLEAIQDLPVGGRRTGELVLWMAAANPAEWGARWDQLEAMDDRAGTWPEKQRLMMLWVAQDAEGAYRHVRGTASEAIFFRALAREDATEAMRLAADRNHFLQEAVLFSLAEVDPFRAMELVEEGGKGTTWAVREGIATGLMKDHPKMALDFIRRSKMYGLAGSRLREWALRDPEAALDWALQDDLGASGEAVPIILERIPETFAARVEELPTGSRKVGLLVQRAAWLARSDPGLAVELARKEGRRPRVLMLNAVASQLAGTNHELMSEILPEIMASNQRSPDPFNRTVLRSWGRQELESNPVRFLEMSEVHEPSQVPDALRIWAERDETAVREWVSQSPQRAEYLEVIEKQ